MNNNLIKATVHMRVTSLSALNCPKSYVIIFKEKKKERGSMINKKERNYVCFFRD